MGFIDSYKRLEKLCGEVYDSERKISAYIDEMLDTPRGAYFVRGWDDDLKRLKHYRWIRNKIVHDPGCSEENMCEPEDIQWLESFYFRIMNQTDPLAMYHKTISSRKQASAQSQTYYGSTEHEMANPLAGCLMYVACFALIASLLFFVLRCI